MTTQKNWKAYGILLVGILILLVGGVSCAPTMEDKSQFTAEQQAEIDRFVAMYGIDVNPREVDEDECTLTLLHRVSRRDIAFVKYLVSLGGDINAYEDDYHGTAGTPLHLTVRYGDVDAVKLLVAVGADVYARGYYGEPPIVEAVMYNENVEVTKFLFSQMEKVNTESNFVLRLLGDAARWNGNIEIVKFLVSKIPDADLKSKAGRGVLFQAAGNQNIEVVKFLVSKGMDVNAKGSKGETSLHSAAYHGNVEVAEFLISKGADVNAEVIERDDAGTPLHWAAGTLKIEAAKLLISKGAEIDAKNDEGMTPLYVAVKVMLFRRETKCDEEAFKFVEVLVSAGADLHGKDENGNTLLHLAANHDRNPDLIKLFVSKGADIHAKNKLGQTPLDCAKLWESSSPVENTAVAEYLESIK